MTTHPPGWEPHGHYTIAVDFDGVLHSYTSPWTGAHLIPDPPILGALPWLTDMIAKFRVVIFSTRCTVPEGCDAVREYLRADHGTCYDPVEGRVLDEFQVGLGDLADDLDCTGSKPAALIYLDDRAVRFDGTNYPTRNQIHQELIPWNKRPLGDSMRSSL